MLRNRVQRVKERPTELTYAHEFELVKRQRDDVGQADAIMVAGGVDDATSLWYMTPG